jgi:hypothetical protein
MYFLNINSIEALKEKYRALAMENHPDRGGNTSIMQDINLEFDTAFNRIKSLNPTATKESGPTVRKDFFTKNGWEGSAYNPFLTKADILNKIKVFTALSFPGCKFQIRIRFKGSYIPVISIELMSGPFEAYEPGSFTGTSYIMTPQAMELKKTICSFVQSFQRLDIDVTIDYHEGNFEFYFAIGKYNKPYIVKPVNKTRKPKVA